MTLRVKDWARFQHYRHRRPPWIRLHRKLLDDPTWHSLPLASRALAPMLWLLASETADGTIEHASNMLAFRLHLASTDFEEALNPLISVGWIEIIEPASNMLAPCYRPMASEFRVQSPDDLIQNLTDAAREPAPDSEAPARAHAGSSESKPSHPIEQLSHQSQRPISAEAKATRELLADITAAKRAAFLKGNR